MCCHGPAGPLSRGIGYIYKQPMKKVKKIIIAIVALPCAVLILALIAVIVYYFMWMSTSVNSKAFKGNSAKPAEFNHFVVNEMKVQSSDTVYLFGHYVTTFMTEEEFNMLKSPSDSVEPKSHADDRPAVLRTYDGGRSWTRTVIEDWTTFTSFFFVDDYAIYTHEETNNPERKMFVSKGDYSTWDSIGQYKLTAKDSFQVNRIKDSTQGERLEFIAGHRKIPRPHLYVDHDKAKFARNDTNWIVGTTKYQIFIYRLEEGKAQLRAQTDFGDKKKDYLVLNDFVAEGNFLAAVISDGYEYNRDGFTHSFLFYSTDGGKSWKREKVSSHAHFYRIKLEGDKIVLVYCSSSYFALHFLTLPLNTPAQ